MRAGLPQRIDHSPDSRVTGVAEPGRTYLVHIDGEVLQLRVEENQNTPHRLVILQKTIRLNKPGVFHTLIHIALRHVIDKLEK